MAFSPDQSLLATFSYDGSTSLWDTTAQGELARPLATLGQPRDDIMDEVLDARFSPDGRLLATNSNGSVRLWDTSARDENVQPRAVLPTGTDFIKGMKLSPDGKLLATITGNDAAQLWATDAHGTVQPVATLGRPGEVLDVEFSPNGELVAVANLATIQLWSTATRDQNAQPLATLTGHTQLATDVVFSPDGELVVAVSAFSGSALVWKSAARSENVAPLVTLADVAGVRFSQDGKLFAAYGGDTVRLWDIGSLNRNAPPVATYSAAATDFHDLVYSPDSAMFATLSRSGGSAFLWDATARGQNIAPLATMVKDGGENSPQDFDLGILGAVFSPDGRLLVTASSDTAQLWDADARGALKPLAALPGEPSYLYDTVFSPDGKLLATSSYDNNALLWDFDPGRLVAAACAEQANRLTEAEWKAVVPDAADTPPCS